VRAVIAFPDFPRYRELYRQTAGQLQKCDIELWWITREGNVTVAAPQPELDQPRNCRLPRGHRSPADWTLGVVTDGHIKSAIAADLRGYRQDSDQDEDGPDQVILHRQGWRYFQCSGLHVLRQRSASRSGAVYIRVLPRMQKSHREFAGRAC
jgi:hypothetical protein